MRRLFVFTGAGLSAESGVATFRTGVNPRWAGYDLDVVCNFTNWKQNAEKVHEFYNMRRTELVTVEPNEAHRALAMWEDKLGATLMTQNVDDLLERAGAKHVVHLHGELTKMRCTACGHVWEIGCHAWDPEADRCPVERCQSRKGVKPHVVFFHEQAPEYAKLYGVLKSLTREDVVVVMGTACEVVPFDQLLEGRPCLKIFNSLNPEGELGTDRLAVFDVVLPMPATEACRLLTEQFSKVANL